MSPGSLSARVDRLFQGLSIDPDSPVVQAALLSFLETGELPEGDDRILDVVLGEAEFALLGFEELGAHPTPDIIARARERGASRYYMSESVELPVDIAERLDRVRQLIDERRGPIDPAALAYL